jgi:tetratricopeptide (TPR) repeat protein
MPISILPLFRKILSIAGAVTLSVVLAAETTQREYSLQDNTSENLPKYKAALDAKNYAEALNVINSLIAKVPAEGYDMAYLLQLKMQIYLQQGDFSKSIEPMERSLTLSEANTPTFFDERITRELYFFLVQLYFQEATQTKNSTLAASYFDKAEKAMERWLKLTPKTNAEAQLIYAQLLFSKGMINADKPDLPLLKRAIEQIELGLQLTTRPKDTFYVLKLVCLQQLDRNSEAAELLELLLKQKPDSNTYWQQLAAIYLNLGANFEGKDQNKAMEYSVRSIVTIERAQDHGFMNTPKDHFNLVGIYFNIGQYEKAAELLETDLASGKIDNETKNWELLSLCYQQLQRPLKGIEALKQATKSFPNSGQLEFLIGQAYTSLDQPENALPHIQAAITKGNLNKPYQAQLALAYTAYSLKKYDLALVAARKATEYPEGAKDGQNMVRALEDILKDREAKKNKS